MAVQRKLALSMMEEGGGQHFIQRIFLVLKLGTPHTGMQLGSLRML